MDRYELFKKVAIENKEQDEQKRQELVNEWFKELTYDELLVFMS